MSEMNPDYTPAIPPDILDPKPFAPFAGDHTDDDGGAIDDYFEAANQGPQSYEGVRTDVNAIAAPNRVNGVFMFIRSGQMALGSPAYRVFAPDVNRLSLHFFGTFDFYWSAEPFSTRLDETNGVSSGIFYQPSVGVIDLPQYTGPLYIAPTLVNGDAVIFQGWAVTK